MSRFRYGFYAPALWLPLLRRQGYASACTACIAGVLLAYVLLHDAGFAVTSPAYYGIMVCFALSVTALHARGVSFTVQELEKLFYRLRKPAEDPQKWQELSLPLQELALLRKYIEDMQMRAKQADAAEQACSRERSKYQNMIASLQTLQRQHFAAHPLLAAALADYALLAPPEAGQALPAMVPFDLYELLDTALATARLLQPPADKVHLAVSVESGTPRRWLGRPAWLETLLRQLLLIALGRSRLGFITLRLKIRAYEGCDDQAVLHLHMEDSGASLQTGKLQQLLNGGDGGALDSTRHAVRWRILANAAKLLNCTLSAQSQATGMTLNGPLQLETVAVMAPQPRQPSDKEGAAFVKRTRAPLVLVVEDNAKERIATTRLFAQAGCRTFIVDNHRHALQWAAVLPVSAVVVNAALPDAGEHLPRTLQAMGGDGTIPDIPLWAMIAQEPFMQFDHWHGAGVSEILPKPLRLDMLQPLCQRLLLRDSGFYRLRDARVDDELPVAVKKNMSQMHEQLNQQLVPVEVIARTRARGRQERKGTQEAHAVRSAALSLGYFRLAGCMSEIEHAITDPQAPSIPENWEVIAECLQGARF